MKGFIAGVFLTLFCIADGAFVYFSAGFAPVATAASPMPFEKRLARMALNARLKKEMPTTVPIEPNEANYLPGAKEYVEHCAVCHGVPGEPPTAIASGMFPPPPQLFKGTGVTDDSPGETYWKIANGIRLTGMPSFNKHLSEMEMWQIALLLANADKIPASVTTVLKESPENSLPPGHVHDQSH